MENESLQDPWNRAEERALINILPTQIGNKLIDAQQKRPELFGIEEHTLLKVMKKERCMPTATDNRLRLNFWSEYDSAQTEGRNMRMGTIVGTVCLPAYFYNGYLIRPDKCAWLVCRPASYETLLEEGLAYGLEQLREVLSIPHLTYNTDGEIAKYDSKLIEIKAKIVAMFDQRVKGAVVQRIEQKTMALNMNVGNKQISELAVENSMEEIENRLKELAKRDRKHQREIAAQSTEEIVE